MQLIKQQINKTSATRLRGGNLMPPFGLGTWLLTSDTAATVAYALELGYPMIDTSSDYRTQPGIGAALRMTGIRRENIFISTKVEEADDAYARTKNDLKELGLQFADLMLIHRPPLAGAGERLWEGLIRARDEGLARDIGVSNYSPALIDELVDASGEIPAVNQIEWSPFGHSEKMRRYCLEKNIVIQAYSPLTRATRLNDAALMQLAQKYRKTAAQILIRWNIQQGTVPIPKANQKHHLEENINVFDFEIGKDDIKLLNGLNEGYSSLGYLPYI